MSDLDLDEAVLVELTNVGTVRRAVKELDKIDVTFAPDGDVWVATSSDDTVQRLGGGHFDTWSCTCPAEHKCRHIVRAVLAWQKTGSTDGGADANGALASGDGASPEPATEPEVAAVSVPRSDGLFPPRVQTEADRLLAAGVLAHVSRVPRLLVRLHYPVTLNVRFPAGADARYARCECGAVACVHLALALAAVELAGDTDGALVSTGEAASRMLVEPARQAQVAWRAWLSQLIDAGLASVEPLLGGAVRLASQWEAERLLFPADAVRDIASQLEHHRSHDAQLSPERLVQLIGEVEARLASLTWADAPAPERLVAGSAGTEVRREQVRLLGLGAEYRHVGGWNQMTVPLLDLRTGAVSSLITEAEDTDAARVQPGDLLKRRRNGLMLGDWARGTALVPVLTRRGSEITLGRGRVTVAPTTAVDSSVLAAVAPTTFAEVRSALPDLPAPLASRRSSDGFLVVPVAAAGGVEVDLARGFALVSLEDSAGEVAELRFGWTDRTRVGVSMLISLLEGGGECVVAGRWHVGADGLEVSPTAVWGGGGVVLPQVGVYVASGLPADLPDEADTASPQGDSWDSAWAGVSELLSSVLVLGARRGTVRLQRQAADLARTLRESGLMRVADLVDQLPQAFDDPNERVRILAALAVRLAFG